MIKCGTISGYSKGCRCNPCRDARREYIRAWRRKNGISPQGNPVDANGVVYPTQRAAAAALGVTERVISYHLNKYADFSRVGKKSGGGKGGRKNPVECMGREWQSVNALSQYVGVAHSTMWRWIRADDRQSIIGAIMRADARQRRDA